MRLKFLASRRGPDYCYPLGSVRDVPDELARAFVKAGAAVVAPAPNQPAQPQAAEPEQKPERTSSVDDSPIDALDLDDSTLAALKDHGFQTVGEVADHEDLTKVPGIGKPTAAKIRKAIMEL